MIGEYDTKNSNGPIESLKGIDTLKLIEEDKTINYNGPIKKFVDISEFTECKMFCFVLTFLLKVLTCKPPIVVTRTYWR